MTLAITDLADLLPIVSGIWEPLYQQEVSSTGAGEALAADLGPMLWGALIETAPMYLDEAKQLRARILLLDGSIGTFYFWSPEAKGPQADPTGAILDGAEVEIESVGTDNHSLAFNGLPEGYELTIGDMLHVDYGSPSRRALFALTESGVASSGGVTPELDVRPHVRPGILAGASVTLIKPAAKVKIMPDTLSIANQGGLHASIRFRVRQTLQAG
jgi:hypothetical protein